jgi:hypothetical protein
MEHAERFLSNPILWGVIALITFAVALSGKLSMTASMIVMWIACALALFGSYRLCVYWDLKGVILVLAIVGAACVLSILTILAIRWTNDRQSEIEKPQISFVSQQDRLVLYNKGKKDFYLFGDKFDAQPPDMANPPVVVPKDGYYYLLNNLLQQWALANIGQNGQRLVPFAMYFMDEDKTQKFVGKFKLLIVVTQGVVTTHTQMFGVVQENW